MSGRMLVTSSDKAVVVSPSETYRVPPGEPHSATPIDSGTLVLVSVSPLEETYRTTAR